MSEIVTLTMNPAVDRSVETEHVVPDQKLRCRAPRLDPGGDDVNVARAIRRGGSLVARYQGSDERRTTGCPTTRPEAKR
jgi:fructose-1-phosphate kinase PfkB-like protein